MTDIRDDAIPPVLRRLTVADRVVRFAFGAVPAIVAMLALSQLLPPMPVELFFLAMGAGALAAAAACAAWGDRFLETLLRVIDRIS
jgi:hypothetical protein